MKSKYIQECILVFAETLFNSISSNNYCQVALGLYYFLLQLQVGNIIQLNVIYLSKLFLLVFLYPPRWFSLDIFVMIVWNVYSRTSLGSATHRPRIPSVLFTGSIYDEMSLCSANFTFRGCTNRGIGRRRYCTNISFH